MNKTSDGWELLYTFGPGNYEYKFIVDKKWITDPANPISSPASGNSFLIIDPNYTFRLKGFKKAKSVFLAGDFNGWDPKAYAMKKEGDDWIFPVHLSVGKHLYKFVVDDKWMNDPANPLWEQNEYSTGNSILWIGR
jgi:1,4-alpha-glucan branching enzyme